MVEALLVQLNPLFPESMFGHHVISPDDENLSGDHIQGLNSRQIEHNVISLLQNKNSTDYSLEIEILMYESNPMNI